MENRDKNKQPISAKSEDYDIENPQKLNLPKFNSTSENRESHKLPYVENADNTEQFIENDQKTIDDSALFGNSNDTDLGNNIKETDDTTSENRSLDGSDPGHDTQPRKGKNTDDEERIISR